MVRRPVSASASVPCGETGCRRAGPTTKSGARAGGRRLSDRRLQRWLAGTSTSAASSHGAADLLGLNRAHICVRNLASFASALMILRSDSRSRSRSGLSIADGSLLSVDDDVLAGLPPSGDDHTLTRAFRSSRAAVRTTRTAASRSAPARCGTRLASRSSIYKWQQVPSSRFRKMPAKSVILKRGALLRARYLCSTSSRSSPIIGKSQTPLRSTETKARGGSWSRSLSPENIATSPGAPSGQIAFPTICGSPNIKVGRSHG